MALRRTFCWIAPFCCLITHNACACRPAVVFIASTALFPIISVYPYAYKFTITWKWARFECECSFKLFRISIVLLIITNMVAADDSQWGCCLGFTLRQCQCTIERCWWICWGSDQVNASQCHVAMVTRASARFWKLFLEKKNCPWDSESSRVD